MKNRPSSSDDPSRRRFVVHTVGGLAGTALLGGCGDGDGTEATGSEATGTTSGAGGENTGGSGSGGAGVGGSGGAGTGGSGTGGTGGQGACTLYPQQTEGPFYLDDDLVRSDITEGKPGMALTLVLRILSSDGCTPIEGVAVDVWQNDAGGVYSGYPNQVGGLDTSGQTFLRGTQITDAAGEATFTTIYPGWYPGRTTHIHFKVHPTPTTEVTSQLYFPEDVTAVVYETSPYDVHGPKDTTNAQDGAFKINSPPLLAVTQSGGAYFAELEVTIAG